MSFLFVQFWLVSNYVIVFKYIFSIQLFNSTELPEIVPYFEIMP